ncbi:MAG: hypothetical protein EWV48_02035, partial [Microcystis aeruginosa Ma_QC_C_20070823_S13]
MTGQIALYRNFGLKPRPFRTALILSKYPLRKMFVLEFKVKAKTQQYQAIDDAIRTAQFIR